MRLTGKISISVWFDPYDLSNYGRLVDKTTFNQPDGYMLDESGNVSNMSIRMIVAGVSASQPTSHTFINHDSTWYNIITTYDSTSVKFYINGTLDTTYSITGASPNNTNPLRIGANSILNGNFFHGKLDDIAIYNRALTASEVTQIYTGAGCTHIDTVTVYDTTHVTIHDTITAHVTVYDTVTTHLSVTDTLYINAHLTGVLPPNNLNELRVYPNPAKTDLFIDCGNYASMSGYTIKVINSIGQTVYSTTITQQQYDINLSSWSGQGIYILTITDQSNTVVSTKEIVLQ